MSNSKTEHQQKLTFWRSVFFLALFFYFLNNLVLYFGVAEKLSMLSITGLLAIKLIPLLALSPSVVKPNFKAAIAFCCLLLFYFIFTADALFQEGYRRLLGITEALIFAGLFWSAFKLGKLH